MTSTGQAAPAKSEKDDLFQKVFLDAQTRRMEKTELSNFYDRVAHIYDKVYMNLLYMQRKTHQYIRLSIIAHQQSDLF